MIAERIDIEITKWSKILALILFGWFSSSAYHGVFGLTQKAKTLQTVQMVIIPKLKAANHCESARGDKAAMVAKKAIIGAVSDTAPIPDPKEIPVDNCQHPAVK